MSDAATVDGATCEATPEDYARLGQRFAAERVVPEDRYRELQDAIREINRAQRRYELVRAKLCYDFDIEPDEAINTDRRVVKRPPPDDGGGRPG